MLVKSLFLKILIYVLRALFFSLFLAFSYHLLTHDLRKNFISAGIFCATLSLSSLQRLRFTKVILISTTIAATRTAAVTQEIRIIQKLLRLKLASARPPRIPL